MMGRVIDLPPVGVTSHKSYFSNEDSKDVFSVEFRQYVCSF